MCRSIGDRAHPVEAAVGGEPSAMQLAAEDVDPEQLSTLLVPPADPAHAPTDATPAAIEHLPTAINAIYAAAAAAALHPVFQTGAAVLVVAFALSWRLRDVRLRATTQAPVGASERELRTLAGSRTPAADESARSGSFGCNFDPREFGAAFGIG